MTEEWREDSLCKGKHADIWYPPLEATNISLYNFIAKSVCERCPVWKQCLTDAAEETWGTWGGLTPQERRSMHSLGGAHLRPHGTISRHRQGCRCTGCRDAEDSYRKPITLKFVPNAGDDFDLITVKDLIKACVS